MISGAKVVNMTTLIGPKRAHKQQTHIFVTYFEIQDANQKLNNPARDPPGLPEPDILGSFRRHFGSLWAHFGTAWGHSTYMSVTLKSFY